MLGLIGGVLLDCWVYGWWPWNGVVWTVLLASGPTCYPLKETSAFTREMLSPGEIPPTVKSGDCVFYW